MPIQAGAALSMRADTKMAVREAIPQAMARAGLERADWAACFFSMEHQPRADLIGETIRRETGCAALFGCSAAGIVGAMQEVEGNPGLAVMVGDAEHLRARSAILPGDGAGIADLADNGGGDSILLALPDAYRVDAAALLARMAEERPGQAIYGAGATDNGTTGISLQLGMEGVRSNSVAALAFRGDFEVAVGITQSCVPAGEPHFVTAARDNILLEIDGRPAIHAYTEQGKALGMVDFQQLVEELLLGFPLDSDQPSFSGESCLVRHLVGFEQQAGGLEVAQQLDGQGAMIFMHRNGEMAERDMRRMTESLAGRLSGPPDFGFYFDCAARGKRLYGREGVDTAIIAEVLGDFPLIGMMGGFEMATNANQPLLYTYTGVLVLVRSRAG